MYIVNQEVALRNNAFYLAFIVFGMILIPLYLHAQTAPYWVTHLTVKQAGSYYFGIGSSPESQKAADDDARGEFSKNVSVKVQSVTDSYLEDSGENITDSFKQQLKVESGLDLRGVNITERFYDAQNKTYYSLIKYKKEKYLALFKQELQREMERLHQENLTKEQKEKEQIRHEQEMARLQAEKERKELELQRKRDRLEAEKARARQQHLAHIMATRGNFVRMAAPHKMLTLPTAEIGNKMQEVSVTPSLKPFGLLRADYAFYWKILALSFNVSEKEEFFNWQEFALKLRLLKGRVDVYKTALALGAIQYSHDLNSFKNFNHEHLGYSLFLSGNVSIPQAYTYASLYVDRRKAAIGFHYYPFFNGLKGKLILLLQGEFIFDQDFRDRFGDKFLLQPGLRFAVIPGFFATTISYQLNEYIAWGFTFKL